MSFISSNKINLLISSLITGLALFALDDQKLFYLFIVLGQGHFLVTYFYTIKAGKVDQWYRRKFLAGLFLFGLVCFYALSNPLFFKYLIFMTLAWFVTHYFNDELRICEFDQSWQKVFGGMAVTASFSILLLFKIFIKISPVLVGALFLVLVVSSVLFLIQISKIGGSYGHKRIVLAFFLLNVIVPILIVSIKEITIYQVAGTIILFHYMRWYLYYACRFKGEERLFYFKTIFWINCFVALLFFEYYLAPNSGLVQLLFKPVFFYGWTLLHIFLSVRKEDYLFSLKSK